jgi:nucleoside-diphosphate-sugar epimerase
VRIAVTGATGFLGRAVSERLLAAGHDVIALVRDPQTASRAVPGARPATCRLPETIDESVLAGAEWVVHAAWATTETDPVRADAVNEDGTRRVVDAARRADARVLFVSSIAARPDAPSRYGRSKWAMEQILDPARAAVLRPGLVIGPGARGLFGQLGRAAARLHLVPVFDRGRQPLQVVHVTEVAEAALRIAERRLTGVFALADPDPIDLAAFLRLMTREMGVRCLFVPLPLPPVLALLRWAERLGVPLPLRSESLLGMQGMRRTEVAESLARLEMTVRPARESITACALAPS